MSDGESHTKPQKRKSVKANRKNGGEKSQNPSDIAHASFFRKPHLINSYILDLFTVAILSKGYLAKSPTEIKIVLQQISLVYLP
jgi:hypothetical protein